MNYSEISCHQVMNESQKEMAYRIRYQAYLEKYSDQYGNAYSDPNAEQKIYTDSFDNAPNTKIFLLYRGKSPIASGRIMTGKPHEKNLSLDHRGYSSYYSQFREKGKTITEFGKLSFLPKTYARQSELRIFQQVCIQSAKKQGANIIAMITLPKDANLWSKFFGFKKLEEIPICKEGYPPIIPLYFLL